MKTIVLYCVKRNGAEVQNRSRRPFFFNSKIECQTNAYESKQILGACWEHTRGCGHTGRHIGISNIRKRP